MRKKNGRKYCGEGRVDEHARAGRARAVYQLRDGSHARTLHGGAALSVHFCHDLLDGRAAPTSDGVAAVISPAPDGTRGKSAPVVIARFIERTMAPPPRT